MTTWNLSNAVVSHKRNPDKVYKGSAVLYFDADLRPTVIQVTMGPTDKVTVAFEDYEIAHA